MELGALDRRSCDGETDISRERLGPVHGLLSGKCVFLQLSTDACYVDGKCRWLYEEDDCECYGMSNLRILGFTY